MWSAVRKKKQFMGRTGSWNIWLQMVSEKGPKLCAVCVHMAQCWLKLSVMLLYRCWFHCTQMPPLPMNNIGITPSRRLKLAVPAPGIPCFPYVCRWHKDHASPCIHMPWMLCFPVYTYAMNAMNTYVYLCHECYAFPCIHMPWISCFIHVYRCHKYHASSVYTNPMNPVHFYGPLRRCHTTMESVCLSVCSALLPILHLGASKHGYLKQNVILWQPAWYPRRLLYTKCVGIIYSVDTEPKDNPGQTEDMLFRTVQNLQFI